jgi:hypothetical protein
MDTLVFRQSDVTPVLCASVLGLPEVLNCSINHKVLCLCFTGHLSCLSLKQDVQYFLHMITCQLSINEGSIILKPVIPGTKCLILFIKASSGKDQVSAH